MKANRARQLCWRCYRTARAQYPSVSKFAVRGSGIGASGRQLPPPTTARPGTPEKMAVLESRAELGLRLWHPDDARA